MLKNLLFHKDIHKDKILGLSFTGLKIFGFVCTLDQHIFELHFLRGIVLTISFTLINIMQGISLFHIQGNLMSIAPAISTTLLFFTIVCRMFSFFANYKDFGYAIRKIHEDLKTLVIERRSTENDIFQKHVKHLYYVNLSLWIPCLTSASLTAVTAVYFNISNLYYDQPQNHTENVPFMFKVIPFGKFSDNVYIAYVIPVYGIVIASSFLCFWNSFVAALMVYIILLLDIINDRLENIEDFVVANNGNINEQRMKIIGALVRSHIMLKKFVTKIESLIGGTVFLDFVVFSVLLCFLLYVSSQVQVNLDFFIMLLYINTMISVLWLFHWHGNEITISSQRTSGALYLCGWYNYPNKLQRLCLIAMTGSTRPIKLRAFFIDVGVVTFMSILRASYSYFTLVKNSEN